MRTSRCLGFGVILLGATLTACVGGRGSSGFDITENAAITHAIDTQQCVVRQGLTICPAGQSPTVPASATPTDTPLPTTTTGATPPAATQTPTPMGPTPPTATPTASTTPTATVVQSPGPYVSTSLGNAIVLECVEDAPHGPCRYVFSFTPQNFPPGTGFRVATRAVGPNSNWQLADPPVATGSDQSPSFATTVALASTTGDPPANAQFAVLVFSPSPDSLPEQFEELVETAAEFAFVTQVLSVHVVTTFPPPTPTSNGTPGMNGSTPQITYSGVARADDVALQPTAFDQEGRPIYLRPSGAGMSLIIEAHPGSTGSPVGVNAFFTGGNLPDMQVLVSRALGDGSEAVCAGGVPATDPLVFSTDAMVVDAINDLGCHVNDGVGNPIARKSSAEACTRSDAQGGFGFGFVDPTSTVQFCLPVVQDWAFPEGDTIVAIRVRDANGELSPVRQIVIRVGETTPSPTSQVPTSQVPTTATATPTPTPSPLEDNPQITYMGVVRADYVPVASSGTDPEGRPIFERLDGFGLGVVIEARPGASGQAVGAVAFNASGALPDLQLLVSRPLGNGSPAVCDQTLPDIGGVPGTNPLVFSDAPAVVDAINDLGCRVRDGAGNPYGVSAVDACTQPNEGSGEFGFVDATSTIQYCLPVAAAWTFPQGDTIVAARVRDSAGTLSATREIVVRIATASPTQPPTSPTVSAPLPTATATPTALPEQSGPQITYLGVARADDTVLDPQAADPLGRLVFVRLTGQGMSLIIEAQPGATGSPVGIDGFNADGGLPDVQILVSRPLGDGSPEVCDDMAPDIGGVPATEPFTFSDMPVVVDAINDLGCRVNDGAGGPLGRTASGQACTHSDVAGGFGFGFVNPASTIQYCVPIAEPWGFPLGDTIVAVRVRDVSDTVGEPQEIVIRVTGP